MEKTIIALRGKADIGKTSTLKEVYKLLKDNYTIEIETENTNHNTPKADIKVIFKIKGIRIGIASQGDPGYGLEKSLEEFARKDCTIIICATRTRGKTYNAVEAQKPLYKVIWNTQEENKLEYPATNNRMARKIFTEAEKAWA